MIEIAGAYFAGRLLDEVVDRFGSAVFARWTKYRANQFLEAFCEEVCSGSSEQEHRRLLGEVFNSDVKTEALFEAYRRVSLARSKTIGPRAIGLLTARIVAENRASTEQEDRWAEAFETLSDSECLEVRNFYADIFDEEGKMRPRADSEVSGFTVKIKWSESTSGNAFRSSFSPTFDLRVISDGVAKLERLGLIQSEVKDRIWTYEEDSERGIDQNGTARTVSCMLYLSTNDAPFAALIQKALPAAS